MILRLIENHDMENVVRLHRQVLPSAGGSLGPFYLHDKYARSIRLPSRFPCLVAVEGNHVLGVLSGIMTTKDVGSQPISLGTALSMMIFVMRSMVANRVNLRRLVSHVRVMGFVSQETPTTSYIDALFVSPKVQGQGIGTKLVRRFEHDMRTIGQKRIIVDTIGPACQATKFYRSCGFSDVQRLGSALILQKPLR